MSTNHTTGNTPFGLGTTESVQHHSSFGDALADTVEFRVIRPGSPVRRLRLTGNRYTFGSADGCSIRLSDQALRPMHAVLIRDGHRILVRAYSVPLEVNGSRTTETILQVGDVMRMGAYRFELLWAPGMPMNARAAPSAIPTSSNSGLQQEDSAWQEQLRREAEQWRSARTELATRETSYTSRESVLHDRESELWNRAEQLRHREVDLLSQETAINQIRQDYASKKREVSGLLEENRSRQLEIEKLDADYQLLESEYRQYAEQAKRQLEHSQQQAETATEAVQRMRDQFAALNQQLEEFSQQQQELELSRNQAIEAQSASEEKCRWAEQRAAEIASELDLTRDEVTRVRREQDDHQQATEQLQQANEQLRHANEKVQQANDKLQQQVVELQHRFDEANSEASQLRQDYEGALASVRQLELLVDQTKSQERKDRQSWVAETEELRRIVEQISVDLARANAELSEVREVNESLTRQLADSEQQRLEAQSDAQSRPTTEAFESLSRELKSANVRLDEMQREHQDRLAELTAQREREQRHAEQLLSEQREANRLEAERKLAEALAEQQRHIANASISTTASDSGEASKADLHFAPTASSDEPAASMIADSDAGTGSDEPSSEVATSTAHPQDPETEVDHGESDSSDNEEGWPTYDSELSAGQSPVTEIDAEIGDSVSSIRDMLADLKSPSEALPEHSSSWDSVTEQSHSETYSESDAEQPVAAQSPEHADDDGSVWRVESKQVVEPMGDREAWTTEDETDSETELEAQDGVVHWQDESPEISVGEMIDNIEQNVDQVIADTDASEMPQESVDSASKISEDSDPAGSEDSDPAGEDDPAEEDAEATGRSWGQFEEVDEHSLEDEKQSTGWQDRPIPWAWKDAEVDPNNVQPDSVEDNLTVSRGSENTDVGVNDVEGGPYANTGEHDSSAGLAADDGSALIEPVDGASPDDWSSQSAGAIPDADVNESEASDQQDEDSFAQMLIRDLDASNAADTEQADDYENTYVMSEFSEALLPEHVEATQVWDRALPSDDASTDGENPESEAEEADENLEQSGEVNGVGLKDALSVGADDADTAGNDSIEAYMNRLLQRVQRDDDTELAETSTLSSSSLNIPTDLADEESSESASQVDSQARLIPRSQAPERSHDLSAMRELANSSARNAVAHSVRIQARDTQLKGMMKLLQVGVALMCAFACYFFLTWGFLVKSMAIIAILVIAGILAQEALVLLTDARRRLRIADETSEESDFYEPVAGLQERAATASKSDGRPAESDPETSTAAGDDLLADATANDSSAEHLAGSPEKS